MAKKRTAKPISLGARIGAFFSSPNAWRYGVPIAVTVTILALAWPFLMTGWQQDTIPYDWDTMYTGAEISRRFWINGTPYFSWIPWLCGGLPTAEYAFFKIFAPATFIEMLVGVVPGGKLSYVLWQAVGAWGTARVVKRMITDEEKPSPLHWPIAVTAGLAFGLQGFFLNHLRVGHFGFEFVNTLPWLFEGFLKRSWMQVSFILGYNVISLAIDFAAHLAILAFFFGLVLLARNLRDFWFLLKSVLATVGLSAVVLLVHGTGVSGFVVKHKEYAQSPGSLYRLMTDSTKELWQCDVDCYWEYGNYLGHGFVLLGFAGLAFLAFRRWKSTETRLAIAGGALVYLISLGPAAPFGFKWMPWSIIEKTPILQNMQVNTRFLVEVGFFLAIGWAFVTARLRNPWLQALSILFCLIPLMQFASISYRMPSHGVKLPDLSGREKDQPAKLEIGDAKSWSYMALANRDVNTSCYVALPIDVSRGLVPGAGMLLSAPAGSLEWDLHHWVISLTPEEARAIAGAASREFVLNQNFHKHFSAKVETRSGAPSAAVAEPFSAGGNLAVRLSGPTEDVSRVLLSIEASPAERAASLITVGSWLIFAGFALFRALAKRRAGNRALPARSRAR